MIKCSRIILLFVVLLYTARTTAQKVSFEGFKKVNGVNLYCKVVGEGTPILVVHGGPGMNMEYIEPHLLLLAKKNKLIFFDPRSTGRSDIPADTTATKHQNLIDDIEGLRKVFGIKKLNILAHSWGAKLAVYYALRYPSAVNKLILSDAVPLNHDYDSLQAAYSNNRSVAPELKDKKFEIMNRHITVIEIKQRLAFMYSMYDYNSIDKINITYPENYGDAQIALFRGLTADYRKYDNDIYPVINRIKQPVLVLHGDADATPVAASVKLAESLGNATLVRFDKSGHFPFIEEPQRFADEISNFINAKK